MVGREGSRAGQRELPYNAVETAVEPSGWFFRVLPNQGKGRGLCHHSRTLSLVPLPALTVIGLPPGRGCDLVRGRSLGQPPAMSRQYHYPWWLGFEDLVPEEDLGGHPSTHPREWGRRGPGVTSGMAEVPMCWLWKSKGEKGFLG